MHPSSLLLGCDLCQLTRERQRLPPFPFVDKDQHPHLQHVGTMLGSV